MERELTQHELEAALEAFRQADQIRQQRLRELRALLKRSGQLLPADFLRLETGTIQ